MLSHLVPIKPFGKLAVFLFQFFKFLVLGGRGMRKYEENAREDEEKEI